MAYSISMSVDDGWIDIRHCGPVTFDEIVAARKEATALMRREGVTRVFVDASNGDVSGLSTVQAFRFNATHGEEFPETWRLRIALLVSREQYADWAFFETVARNRGTDLRVFVDANAARTWLTEARPPA